VQIKDAMMDCTAINAEIAADTTHQGELGSEKGGKVAQRPTPKAGRSMRETNTCRPSRCNAAQYSSRRRRHTDTRRRTANAQGSAASFPLSAPRHAPAGRPGRCWAGHDRRAYFVCLNRRIVTRSNVLRLTAEDFLAMYPG
jgi:hypothetical protein